MDNILNFISNASETELYELTLHMSALNVGNRNKDKATHFAEKIIKKENAKKEIFQTFIESSSVNGLIYAPTQVGKSAATIQFIKTCFYHNIPVIVSTDNKLDQQEQLFNRIKDDLVMNDIVLVKASDKTFTKTIETCIREKFNNFVIFCLDNSSQIEKVTNLLSCSYTKYNRLQNINTIAIIHDEADMITKNGNILTIESEQATSHRKWLELHNIINSYMSTINLKRVFVTATPENCAMLYSIDCPDVMRLEIPTSYIGYDKINHISTDNKDTISFLINEVERIKREKTFEAILYCVERKINNGQNQILEDLSSITNCIVSTYNGSGIVTHFPITLKDNFEKLLISNDIDYSKDDSFFYITKLTIRKFYSMIKSVGENCVITIGKDLICRGISYVGEDKVEPITATTIFYKPGMKMHNVGICQTIGRITGCAMPNLKRRLYCSEDVYNNYISYNKNQEIYIKKFQNTDNQITKDIINDLIFNKITRPIDRPKLNLKMVQEVEVNYENESDNEIDGVNLSKLKKWINSDTIVGKITKCLYMTNMKMTFEQIMNEINYNKSLIEFSANINGGKSIKSQYGKLWTLRTGYVTLNKRIREYIDQINIL